MSLFPLFETIAIINGKAQNLAYHQARLDNAMQYYFKQNNTFELSQILQIPIIYQQGLVRCRVDYNATDFKITFYAYTPRKIERFQCVYTDNLDYRFKYSDRKRLEFLKNLHPQVDEIIIINNGYVSDCTLGNLLFLCENQWISSQNYLLKGTQLSYLVEQKVVTLTQITATDLRHFQAVMMVNALNPFDLKRALPISTINFG